MTSLLEETWLGGIESPQYIATKDSAILEPPSKMDKESTLKKNGCLFFSYDNYRKFPTYLQQAQGGGGPESASTSKNRKLISIVCPICT